MVFCSVYKKLNPFKFILAITCCSNSTVLDHVHTVGSIPTRGFCVGPHGSRRGETKRISLFREHSSRTNDMNTTKYTTFRYDTIKVEIGQIPITYTSE